jgi:hypothetical protein
MNELQLVTVRRPSGGGVTERIFLDLVIDGVALRHMVGNPDLISGIGWSTNEYAESLHIDRLLLREPADVADNHRSILICPECGDLACGAVSVLITKTDDAFVWSDFMFDNGYDASVTRHFAGVGPYSFAKAAYWELFENRRSKLMKSGGRRHGPHSA